MLSLKGLCCHDQGGPVAVHVHGIMSSNLVPIAMVRRECVCCSWLTVRAFVDLDETTPVGIPQCSFVPKIMRHM